MSEAEGLARFGIAAKTVVREPATEQRSDNEICPECGTPVSQSIGPQRIHHPELVCDAECTVLPTFGWLCERHPYDVVLPLAPNAREAPSDGWTGVRLELADGRVREIVVPEREVPA